MPQHLLVDGVAEGLQTAGHGLGVGVLRLQVLLDLWVRLFAQPEVGIDYGRPMPRFAVIDAGRGGWCWSLGTHGGSCKKSECKEFAQHRFRLLRRAGGGQGARAGGQDREARWDRPGGLSYL